jgi:hypothetical protein
LSFVEGPLFACAGALVVSGGAKLRNPRPAAAALYAARLPSSVWLVRTLAVAEIALGSLVLVRPGTVACLLLAGAFAALGAVAAVFVVNPRVRSCGCFGDDAPTTWAHVIADATACAVALVAAATALASLPDTLRSLGWTSVAFLAGVWCLVYLAHAAATLLPGALTAYRGRTEPAGHDHDQDHGQAHGDGGAGRRHRHARTEDALRAVGVAEGHPSLWGEQPAGASAR